MTTTIPRAEIRALAECHDPESKVEFVVDFDPPVKYVRGMANTRRGMVLISPEKACTLHRWADDLDALADRYEQEGAQ